MFHYVYKVVSPSGKYYCGRHSTKNMDDGYVGSGKWVRSLKDKGQLKKEILAFADSYEDLLILEQQIIDQCISDDLCMNFHTSSCGFGAGEYNPNCTPTRRLKLRERMLKHNPMKGRKHSDTSKRMISESLKGQNNPFYGKTHSEETRQKMRKPKTVVASEELCKLRSKNAKKAIENGKLLPSFRGRKHTKESLEKMMMAQAAVPKITCFYCGRSMKPQQHSRWHGENCKDKK